MWWFVITKKITILNIGDKCVSDKFDVLNNIEIVSINGSDYVNSITIKSNEIIKDIICDGVFIYLGKEYKIDNYLKCLDINNGFIVTNSNL